MTTGNPIQISAEGTDDPTTFQFTVNRPIQQDGSVFYANADVAKDSPLAGALFGLEGVTAVSFTKNIVEVTADADSRWPDLAYDVGKIVRESLTEMDKQRAAEGIPDDAPLKDKIQHLLDIQINPAIASHGGFAHLVDVKDNKVYIQMAGGCQGCGMASVTLRQGIERSIKESFPQIEEVIDATDHSAGVNPYYAPGTGSY